MLGAGIVYDTAGSIANDSRFSDILSKSAMISYQLKVSLYSLLLFEDGASHWCLCMNLAPTTFLAVSMVQIARLSQCISLYGNGYVIRVYAG